MYHYNSFIKKLHYKKESPGAVFGCERFHDYVYRRSYILGTDQKPLKAISQKPLGEVLSFIQSLILQLQK